METNLQIDEFETHQFTNLMNGKFVNSTHRGHYLELIVKKKNKNESILRRGENIWLFREVKVY